MTATTGMEGRDETYSIVVGVSDEQFVGAYVQKYILRIVQESVIGWTAIRCIATYSTADATGDGFYVVAMEK